LVITDDGRVSQAAPAVIRRTASRDNNLAMVQPANLRPATDKYERPVALLAFTTKSQKPDGRYDILGM
jgi:hypothetical protein